MTIFLFDFQFHLSRRKLPRQYAPERFIILVSVQNWRPFGLPSAKVLCREIPIDQFIQHCDDIVRAPVLVIQVVGVFPHIDGQ